MFPVSYYDYLATSYAEQNNEKCECNTFLKVVWECDNTTMVPKTLKCPKCTKIFPITLLKIIEKIETFTRGLWRE